MTDKRCCLAMVAVQGRCLKHLQGSRPTMPQPSSLNCLNLAVLPESRTQLWLFLACGIAQPSPVLSEQALLHQLVIRHIQSPNLEHERANTNDLCLRAHARVWVAVMVTTHATSHHEGQEHHSDHHSHIHTQAPHQADFQADTRRVVLAHIQLLPLPVLVECTCMPHILCIMMVSEAVNNRGCPNRSQNK